MRDISPQARLNQIRLRVLSTLRQIERKPAPVSPGMSAPAVRTIPIGTGRRLHASILFLDLCAFSRRPMETADDQTAMLRIITLMFSEFICIIEGFGGVVEKNTGDGLMAYFHRLPGEGQNHQSRAVEAALYMFCAAENFLAPAITSGGGRPPAFRITIDSGFITVADVGAKGRFRGMVAIGTAANIASKMLAVAKADQLLIGAATASGLRADWIDHLRFHSVSESFHYQDTARPYDYFEFVGRFS